MRFIYNATVAVPKKTNIERHFLTVHKNYEDDYSRLTASTEEKVNKIVFSNTIRTR